MYSFYGNRCAFVGAKSLEKLKLMLRIRYKSKFLGLAFIKRDTHFVVRYGAKFIGVIVYGGV